MATLLDFMSGMDGGQPNQGAMQAPILNAQFPSMNIPQQNLDSYNSPQIPGDIGSYLQSIMGSQGPAPQTPAPANIQVPFYGNDGITNLNAPQQPSQQQPQQAAPLPANNSNISNQIQQMIGSQQPPQPNMASNILANRFQGGGSIFDNLPTQDQMQAARNSFTAAPNASDYANSISSILTGKYQTGQDIANNNQQQAFGDLSKFMMAPLQTQLVQSEIAKNNAQSGGLFNTPGMGGIASNGAPQNLTGDAYLQTLPPAAAAQVKAASEGKMQLTPMLARSPYGQQLLSAVAQYDPSFDTVDYTKRAETVKAFAPGGKMGQNVTRIDTAMNTLGQVADASDKLGGVDDASILTGPLNSLNVFAKGSENDPALRDYTTLAKTAADEVAAAVGGGNSAEGDRIARMQALTAGQSPEARKAAIQAMMKELNSRLDPVAQAYTEGMGKSINSGTDLLTPSTQASYRKIMGISSATVSAPSTANNLAQKTGSDVPGTDDRQAALQTEARRRGLIQ